jgi:hypothetical protein
MKTSRENECWSKALCLVVPWAVTVLAASEASAQIGACCVGDATCVETNEAECNTLGGEFLGAGTSCAEAVCTGACCLPDGTCTEGSADSCAAGVYQGAGSTCATHCGGPLGTSFTYQGRLNQAGEPLTGTIDVQASLWTAAIGGDPVGTVAAPSHIPVAGGLFTAELDFGAAVFAGQTRWLQIAVRSPHDPANAAPFTTLSPRQRLSAVPYALQTRGLFISDDLRVGIGTASPQGILHVASSRDTPQLSLQQTSVDSLARIRMGVQDGSANWDISAEGGDTPAISFATPGAGFRMEPCPNPSYPGAIEPNWIAGSANNSIGANVRGATIAGGGGHLLYGYPAPNLVTGHFGTVSGGMENVADYCATVGGGSSNRAAGSHATVGGGQGNTASGDSSTVCGGAYNNAVNGDHCTVCGGANNWATGKYSSVGGGYYNTASGETSTVPGGWQNQAGGTYSLAAGRRAKVRTAAQVGGGDTDGDQGTFVWADSTNADFVSTGPNQFNVRAHGGVFFDTGGGPGVRLDAGGNVGIGTASPSYKLHVNGSVAGIGEYQNLSDGRFKKNVEPISDAVEKLNRLDGVSFHWRQHDHPELDLDDKQHLGLIAQNVQKVFPEAVSQDADGRYCVAYGAFVPVLVEAVKSLDAENQSLKERNEQLEARLAAIETAVKELLAQSKGSQP